MEGNLPLPSEEWHSYTKAAKGSLEGTWLYGKESGTMPYCFFPAIPPNTSNGDVTSVHIRTITTIVPNGNAAVAL